MANCRSTVILCEDAQHRYTVWCQQEHIILGLPSDFRFHQANIRSRNGLDVALNWEEEITSEINMVKII